MAITGPQFMVAEWFMIAVSAVLCCIRFRMRYKRGRSLWNICDILVFFAWIFYVAQGVMDTIEYAKGLFDGRIAPDPRRPADQYGPEYGLATLDDTVMVLKLIWVQTCIYYIGMYCVKFAMLGFYYELIPHCLTWLRWATHFATGLSIVGCTSTVLLKLFYCEPIRTNWAVDHTHCKNLDSPVTDIYRWSFHVVTDMIIYVIPLFLLRVLDLPFNQKVGVGLTFAAGFVCIIFAVIVQMTFIVTKSPTVVSFTWATGEMSWSLLVVCLPSFKSFLTHDIWSSFSRMKRKMSNGGDGSSGSDTYTQDSRAVKELSVVRNNYVGNQLGEKIMPRIQEDNSRTASRDGASPEQSSLYLSTGGGVNMHEYARSRSSNGDDPSPDVGRLPV